MNIDPDRFLIVVAGPTAVGKTSATIQMAKHFGFPVISSDSRQLYREMKIGTARPDESELQEIMYCFSGYLSIHDFYNVSIFEKDVLKLLDKLFVASPAVFLSGGSGLYIDAVCNGIDELPDPDPELRQKLRTLLEFKGIKSLQEKLQELDPGYYAVVDRNNPIRLLRAIEVSLITGIPYSVLRTNKPAKRSFSTVKLGLTLP
ncbi:MAG: isopentenyl transferase family protein, partial [Bacteroidota bacterium]|nr:isopentenyl transferase family protein [Bacteroidota bacterium]